MPGILKIGITKRTPETILKEANASDIWRDPKSLYKIEFAKKVNNPFHKEKTLYSLLKHYPENQDSMQPPTGFFNISPEEVIKYFDLMDGEMLTEPSAQPLIIPPQVNEKDVSALSVMKGVSCSVSASNVKGRRNMADCFTEGQLIRHKIGNSKIRIGSYDSSRNKIIYGSEQLSLNKFAVNHYKNEKPDRNSNVNAWKECECEIDGKWISTYSLKT